MARNSAMQVTSGTIYMATIPGDPQTTDCSIVYAGTPGTNQRDYWYLARANDGTIAASNPVSYTLTYCLNGQSGTLTAGIHTAQVGRIQ